MQLGATLAALAVLWGSPAGAASLEEFGYRNLEKGRAEARGHRPLVTILASFAGKPAFRDDAKTYYDQLVYNTFKKSVNGYYLVNSNGRFNWVRAGEGTIGPLYFPAADANLPERQRFARIKEALFRSGFNVAEFDDNRDGKVTTDELAILIIENAGERGAAMRSTDPPGVKPSGATVSLDSNIAAAGHRASMMSMAHELSHLLGTIDLYGSNDLNQALTLMGATIYNADDDMRTYHLDAWHKMQLGWSEPRIYSMGSSGSVVLPAANRVKPDAPVILFDPARGTKEYFMLEYRAAANVRGLHYDENVADSGLVIWLVKQDGSKLPVQIPGMNGNYDYAMYAAGAPDFVRGGEIAWRSGATTPALSWQGGGSTGVRLTVRPFTAGAGEIIVDWKSSWSGYLTLGGGLKGRPVVAQNADGRLEVFVRGMDDALWHIWHGGPNHGWSNWESLGGRITTDPAVGRNKDGRLEVFARGGDGALWHIWQTFQAQPWSGWHSLGGQLLGQPAVGRNADGRLEVFVRGLDRALWHVWQGGPNHGWSNWESLGGILTTDPAVALNRDGHLDVYARGLDNALWHITQIFQAQPWSGWESLGGGLSEAPALGRTWDGQLEVFVRGLDYGLWHQWQTPR
jgi:M6 family metalloprotease-like protein